MGAVTPVGRDKGYDQPLPTLAAFAEWLADCADLPLARPFAVGRRPCPQGKYVAAQFR
jgi:hypothetical protein